VLYFIVKLRASKYFCKCRHISGMCRKQPNDRSLLQELISPQTIASTVLLPCATLTIVVAVINRSRRPVTRRISLTLSMLSPVFEIHIVSSIKQLLVRRRVNNAPNTLTIPSMLLLRLRDALNFMRPIVLSNKLR
jgi:hypothetical protein